MTATVVALAAGFGTLAIALVTLAVRLSGVHRELNDARDAQYKAERERATLRVVFDAATRDNERLAAKLEAVTLDQVTRVKYLREQLDQCGDDSTRGRVAIAGLRRILQAIATDFDNHNRRP